MKNGKAKNPDEKTNTQSEKYAAETISSNGVFRNELREPRWSVVSFDKAAAKNLTYNEAAQKIAELKKQCVSGLCLITDEAAERISGESIA